MSINASSAFQPIEHTSINEAVYRTIRDRLMCGEYRAGEVLGIQELADALAVSTMPVREALRRLATHGAIEAMKSRSLRVPLITPERLEDIRRVRVLIEGAATEWATPRLSVAQIRLLRKLADEIEDTLQSPRAASEGLQRNQVFHFTIYRAAGSPVSMATIESLWLQSGPYLRAARELMHTEASRPLNEPHAAIVDAIERGDAVAARAALECDICWAFDHLQPSVARAESA